MKIQTQGFPRSTSFLRSTFQPITAVPASTRSTEIPSLSLPESVAASWRFGQAGSDAATVQRAGSVYTSRAGRPAPGRVYQSQRQQRRQAECTSRSGSRGARPSVPVAAAAEAPGRVYQRPRRRVRACASGSERLWSVGAADSAHRVSGDGDRYSDRQKQRQIQRQTETQIETETETERRWRACRRNGEGRSRSCCCCCCWECRRQDQVSQQSSVGHTCNRWTAPPSLCSIVFSSSSL